MPTDLLAIVISLLALLGVILGPVFAGVFSARLAASERKETRRREEEAQLQEKLDALIELRSQLQYYDVFHAPPLGSEPAREREQAYGRAYAVMISIPDERIRNFARQALPVKEGEGRIKPMLGALDEAIALMGDRLLDFVQSDV